MTHESNYTFVSISGINSLYSGNDSVTICLGGLNNQSSAAAADEVNLDARFAFGLTYPTPRTHNAGL